MKYKVMFYKVVNELTNRFTDCRFLSQRNLQPIVLNYINDARKNSITNV